MLKPLENVMVLTGLSQAELARRVSYRRETINRLLHDRHRPSREMKRRISEALGVREIDIFPPERPA